MYLFSILLVILLHPVPWRDWNLFDWIVNIGLSVLALFPFVSTMPILGRICALGFGWIGKLLAKLPLIGKIASWLWALKTGLKVFFDMYLMKWFIKGGWLYNLGKAVAQLVGQLRKPWVLFTVLLLSSLADGIFFTYFFSCGVTLVFVRQMQRLKWSLMRCVRVDMVILYPIL